MKIRLSKHLVALIVASLAIVISASAQDSADNLFLKVFRDCQVAEKLERDNSLPQALQKYKEAEKTLQKIKIAEPGWEPLVVDFRLKKVQECIIRLEPAVAKLPRGEDTIEGPLPQRESPSIGEPRVTSSRTVPRQPIAPSRRPGDEVLGSVGELSVTELRRLVMQQKQDIQRLNEQALKKSADLQSAMVELDKIRVRLVEVTADATQATQALEDARKDGTSLVSIRQEYEKRIAALTQELNESRADKEVMDDENGRLLGKLEQASVYITKSDEIRGELLKERQALAKDRDTALARTKKIKDNSAELEKIVADNKQLKQKLLKATEEGASKQEIAKLTAENKEMAEKLAAAEKNLATATAALPEKEAFIASLQGELNSVNDKLLEAQAVVTRADDQRKDLQKQLDETTGELAKLKLTPEPTKEERTLLAENDLLRGIILRQIKDQTRRDEARKLAEQEIASLQIKSEVLNQQLSVLSSPVLQLTNEERSLFKDPISLLNDPKADTMEVTLTMVKPTLDEAATNLTPSQPEGPSALSGESRDLIQKAKQLFDLGNYLDAEKVYQQIVENSPQNYFALSNLGAVQIEAGKLSAAEVALKKASEINAEDSFALTNLGILYCRQGKFEEAISVLKKSLNVNDKDHVAHNYLGVSLGQKNEMAESEKELKRAIEIAPDYAPAHFNLAVLYATMQPPSMELAKHHYHLATKLGAEPDASLEHLIQ